ncbi:DUF4340 domain-containing protein [Treponema parvum]|uniref:DUF4340 domain-containing protein n=1 Tax=Treponema parvum TaxID=138851 RepID=A0A975F2F1_9SPIR|nr:DUF4340 domain-containing protein [Treponema parvum]QTQ13400.1 DUF4340 domain-containing protein [Treponema parvum]
MTKLKMRKSVLLAAIGILLCIYAIQLFVLGRNSVKVLSLKEEAAVYAIKGNDIDVVLTRSGDEWLVGSKNYKANESFSDSIDKAVKTVKILDTVSHSDSEASLERYGLESEKALTVTASGAKGKILRTITVGKESSTGSQTYVKIDSGKDIYLVSGALKNTFEKTVDDLRSKQVFSFSSDDIDKVTVFSGYKGTDNAAGGEAGGKPNSGAIGSQRRSEGIADNKIGWSVEKIKDSSSDKAQDKDAVTAEKQTSWRFSGSGISDSEIDGEKINTWINTLSSLNVQDWRSENAALPDVKGTTTTIFVAGKEITVTVYRTGEGDEAEYIGTSSETPYSFTVSKYTANKFQKDPEEFKK